MSCEVFNESDFGMIEGTPQTFSVDLYNIAGEIYDYLRLLYSKIGKPFCPKCNKEISTQTIDQIVEKLLENEDGTTSTVYGLRYSEFIALNTLMIQRTKNELSELKKLLQDKNII